MRVNDNYPTVNVEAAEKDPNSILHFWRKAIQMRKSEPKLFQRGVFEELDYDNLKTFSYLKFSEEAEKDSRVVFVILNFSKEAQTFSLPSQAQDAKLLLGTVADEHVEEGKLQPYEGRIYLKP